MPQDRSRKIFIYFFLFLLIGTLNNKNLINLNIIKLNKIKVIGLDEEDTVELNNNLDLLRLNNLLFIDKNKVIEIINSNNLKLHPRMKEFYKFFKYNGKIVDIFDFNQEYLSIFSRDILSKIKAGKEGWKNKLPRGIAEMIIADKMFGWKS